MMCGGESGDVWWGVWRGVVGSLVMCGGESQVMCGGESGDVWWGAW